MHPKKCNDPPMKIQITKKILFSFLLTLSLNTANAQGFGGFLSGLKNKIIEATKEIPKELPSNEIQEVDDSLLNLQGTLAPNVKWMMISIMKNNFLEQVVLPIKDGYYETRVSLQDGAGIYDISLYTNSNVDRNVNYTQVKKFSVENTDINDRSYLLPTLKVQSDDVRIKDLAESITKNATNDEEAFLAIYKYVTSEIKYDFESYNDRSLRIDNNAINTLTNSKAVCEGFSNLIAALSRAYGIRTKVIYGKGSSSAASNSHAWNEVFLQDEWKNVDATWDSQLGDSRYLFMNTDKFEIDHIKELETKN